jgi:hypothetical protein
MRTNNLPRENDGVQLILQSFISNSIPDSLLQKILTTMWYIWKTRNNNCFQRKTWTPMLLLLTSTLIYKHNKQETNLQSPSPHSRYS